MQASYLVNVFDNFQEKHSEKLKSVATTEDAVKFVHDMLNEFNVKLFFDPGQSVLGKQKREDDLLQYCHCQVSYNS